MISTLMKQTHWRAAGPYLPTLASKTSLTEESKLFLLTYEQLKDTTAASQQLINSLLLQRSRETRITIVNILRMRLVRWNPPSWVLDDLVAFAHETFTDSLRMALLLHTARHDTLLYDFIQQQIVPRWNTGSPWVMRSDVQSFLDAAQETHPEIARWSHSTREKISRNALTVLRDGGLLKGEASKRIVLPYVPQPVVDHLMRLLQAEGVAAEQLAHHSDWHLFLWNAPQVQKAVETLMAQSPEGQG